MTLQSSGAITLSEVNVELNRSSTTSINLNESAVRELAEKASGAVAMNDLYGKSRPSNFMTYFYQSTFNGIYGIDIDSSRNIYAVGDLGTSTNKAFIIKVNSTGTIVTTNQANTEYIQDVKLDSGKNLLMFSSFKPSTTDHFHTMKVNSAIDTITWQKALYYSGGSSFLSLYSCDVDSSDNVYICGSYFISPNYEEILVAKYNSSGTLQWQKKMANNTIDLFIGSMAVSPSGNCHVTFIDPNFDNCYVIKLDTSGNEVWRITLEGYNNADPYYDMSNMGVITIDSNENVYLSGAFKYIQTGNNAQRLFVMKLNSAGTEQWQRFYGDKTGSEGQYDGGVGTTDLDGNFYIGGSRGGSANSVLIKYNSSGTIQWQRKFVSADNLTLSPKQHKFNWITCSGLTPNTSVGMYVFQVPDDGTKTNTAINGRYDYSTVSLTNGTPDPVVTTTTASWFTLGAATAFTELAAPGAALSSLTFGASGTYTWS